MFKEVTQVDVRRVFQACCLAKSSDEEESILQRECQGDTELRQAVEDLLQAERQYAVFLETSPSSLLGDVDGDDFDLTQAMLSEGTASGAAAKIGSSIRGYKLLQQIGEGGMGSVYMAQQLEPVRRKVALKVIKPGMDSKDVVARFEAERQALAMMDHPNVAKVLDAGTTETGRPYFVMELVHGTPITKFCDENRIPNRDRLQIFVDVCRAVQHAHMKGIIHRDLKPSNVLVTMNDDKPMPKVIDFGVSKALSQPLTEKTMFTAFGQMVGTPLYMSPEQAQFSAHDVDVRSDVYSLGVLLYELLTGDTPFDRETLRNSGIDELRRLIREVDPPRPSARISTLRAGMISTASEQRRTDPRRLSSSLAGELDWIVMKSLEKDRSRRYESARELAADIERYLNDEAVKARPPSRRYQFHKFARRHRGALATAALLTAGLLAGAGLASWQAVRATAAETKAQEDKRQAEENLKSALDAIDRLLVTATDPDLYEQPGVQPKCRQMIADAIKFYNGFTVNTGTSPDLRYRVGMTWQRLGEMSFELKGPFRRELETSVEILQKLVAEHANNQRYQAALAEALLSLAFVQSKINWDDPIATVADLYRRAAGIFEELSQNEPGSAAYLSGHGKALLGIGRSTQDAKVTMEMYQRAYGLAEMSKDASLRTEVFEHIARAYQARDALDRADEFFRRSVTESRKYLTAESTRTERAGHADRLHAIADVFSSRHPEEATLYLQEAYDIRSQIFEDYPDLRKSGPQLGNTAVDLAGHLIELGKLEQARAILERTKTDPGAAYRIRRRGRLQFLLGNHAQALADLEHSYELDRADLSSVWWISAHEVAMCENVEFQHKMRQFADRVVKESDRSTDSLSVRLPLLIEFGEMKQAKRDVRVIVERADEKTDWSSLYHAGLLSIHLGDEQNYQKVCRQMLLNFQSSKSLRARHFTVWSCALAPNALEEYESAIQLARKMVEQETYDQQYVGDLGTILLRAGRFNEAKQYLERAWKLQKNIETSRGDFQYLLALTQHYLGEHDAAKKMLLAANKSADDELQGSAAWNRKLTLELLRKEAEALILSPEKKEDASGTD